MKLDAGDPITYRRLNGGGISIARIIDALTALVPITLQGMFVKDPCGEIDNTTDGVVREWLDALESIRAARVHLYTIDRAPANEQLRPVAPRRLREIAERVRAIGIPADVFVASDRGERQGR